MIKYQLTADGVGAFIDSALGDTFQALEGGHPEECDIYITIGEREIRIPTGADTFGEIESALRECLAIEEGYK
jgi:hypothetical protein